jgi:8-hydroxy-5-deazaflavin:NADPH oxidoreductase
MKIGVLGTGMVGKAIASRLAELGHEERMSSRTVGNEDAVAWAAQAREGASEGEFADAADFGEVVFNCTAGAASLDALAAAGEENLARKLLIDVANTLDFSQGMPPRLSVCNTDSLGEWVQRVFPAARVVKALNTVNCDVMVDPARVPGEHVVFICGNDPEAKREAKRLLEEFG